MRQSLLICSLITFVLFLIFGTMAVFMFHFLGEDGKLHKKFQKQAQKPYVTNIAGIISSLFFVASVIFLLLGLIVY